MQELIVKEVEVRSADMTYKGVLVEIGETEIYLMSDNGWIVLPVEGVAEIKAAE